MTDYCDFNDLPASACAHCNPPEVNTPRRHSPGEKADSGDARAIFKSLVLEARPGAAVRDNGTATQLTVDGIKVWVKATLEEDSSRESYQFHDAAKMLTIDVAYIALVNTAMGGVHIITKADADAEARLQLQTSPAGRISLKPKNPRVQPCLRAVRDVF